MSTRNRPADRPARLYDPYSRDGDDPQPRTLRPVGVSSQQSPKKSRTPNAKNGNAAKFGRTSTLSGAFASTGPTLDNNNNNNIGTTRDVRAGRTPPKQTASRERNYPAVSPRSNASSPRHRDLFGTNRRFSDGDDLGDLGFDDEPDLLYNIDQVDPLSPSPSSRQRYGTSSHYNHEPVFDFFDVSMEEPTRRRRDSQHASDQERLRRATERGPVLSKAMVGNKRRTSTESVQVEGKKEEAPLRFEPSLNIPSTWRQKERRSKDITDRMNREDAERNAVGAAGQVPSREWEHDADLTSHSFQVSDSPPVRNTYQPRRAKESPPPLKPKISPRALERRREIPEERATTSFPREGSPTPIVEYNDLGRDKPLFRKRDDSHDLLRRLARSESPSATNTPEPKHVDDTISNMKTPVVVGAWINTPAPERTATAPEPAAAQRKPSPIPEITNKPDKSQPQQPKPEHVSAKPSPEETKPKPRPVRRPRVELEKPNLPKSALEAVIQEAKAGGDKSLFLGENTIDSLQDLLLDESPDFSEFKKFDLPEAKLPESDKSSSDDDTPGTPPEAPDEAVIDRLNAKLQSLVRNIKEVRDGLSGLETQATNDVAALAPSDKKHGKKPHKCPGKGKHCGTCGLAGDGRLYLALPLPRLWHRRPDTNRLRPTLLGWVLLISLTWWVIECFMCELYCKPLYLYEDRNYTVDPNAPETPWVIPTMLWRWSGLAPVLAPVWTILIAFYRFFAQLLGFWDGHIPAPPEVYLPRPTMDDVTASRMLAQRGFVPRHDPSLDFSQPSQSKRPPPQHHPPVHSLWGQGDTDAEQELSMDGDEIL